MENYTITKCQIKKLADEDSIIKDCLEKWFPDAFKTELEMNKWYRGTFCTGDNPLVFFDSLNTEKNIKAYGFDSLNVWFDHRKKIPHYGEISCTNDWKESTPEEVEAALINEAKKRGYKKGQWIKSFIIGKTRIGSNSGYEWNYLAEQNALSYAGVWVFRDGKWAEILPQEKTVVPMEKALKIIAKKMKVSPENIEIQS